MSMILMFIFILFLIWFLRIISKTFVDNFLYSKFSIDQYLQEISFDPQGLSSQSLFNFNDPFEPDMLFDSDMYPYFYKNIVLQYAFFFPSINLTGDPFAGFANHRSDLRSKKTKEVMSSFQNIFKQDTSSSKLKFYSIYFTWIRSFESYKFNNDLALYYEYQECLKTISNLMTNVNYENEKFTQFDLPWDVVSVYNKFDKMFEFYAYVTHYEIPHEARVFPRFEHLADSSTDSTFLEGWVYDFPSTVDFSFNYNLFAPIGRTQYMKDRNKTFDGVDIRYFDVSEEFFYKEFVYNYNSIFFKNELSGNELRKFVFSIDHENNLISEKENWLNELLYDRFFINLVNDEFLFSFNNTIWKNLFNYVEDSNVKNFLDDHFFLSMNNKFRSLFYNIFSKFTPSSIFTNNIYGVSTIALLRRPNETVLANSKSFFGVTKYESVIQNFDPSNYVLHPHDVIFKLNNNSVILNYTPYYKSNFFSALQIQTMSIKGYEFLDNSFKYIFHQNPNFFVKNLAIKNYPELSRTEAERLWVLLGCNEVTWNKIDSLKKKVYSFDNWEIPFFYHVSCFLLIIIEIENFV